MLGGARGLEAEYPWRGWEKKKFRAEAFVWLKEKEIGGLGLKKTMLFRLVHKVHMEKLNQVGQGIELK